MRFYKKYVLLAVVVVVTLTFLAGCGGRVFAPREGSTIWYYHPELPEAAKAVEDAQKAGKDKECPAEFKAAKNRMEEAYRAYWACRTQEGIAMAKEATAMAKALCPAPPPKPAPAPEPTPPPKPAPAPKVLDKMTLRVNFDFDKSSIRPADEAEMKKAIDFVRKYPDARVKIEGHTDSIGAEKYNQKLSERRAEAVQNYLIQKNAVKKANISTAGFGETKPVADNKTAQGRAENRRAEIQILE